MKFSVLFLFAFVLVAYSSSQRLDESGNPYYWIKPFPWRFSPKFYYPIYFDDPKEAHQKNHIAIDQDDYYYYNDKVVPQLPLTYRISAQVRDESHSNEKFFNTDFRRQWPAQQRLFFNLFNPNGGSNGLFGPFLSNLILSTSISTIFSTVTTADVVLCFPGNRLNPSPPVPCPEKRRFPSMELAHDEFDLTETAPYLLPLVPSTVEKIEPTVKPILIENIPNEPFPSAQPVAGDPIVSSKIDHGNDAAHNGHLLMRNSREMARNFVVTSITTQYVFTSTVFTKTLDQFVGAGQINCLPKGFEVCK